MAEGGRERCYPSLIRPILLAGAERELVIPVVGLAGVLVLGVGPQLLSLALAGGLVFGLLPLLRMAARVDPQMRKVYVRHQKYQSYYPAQGHPSAPAADVGSAPEA
jgi:type IV secretion system protein VirB3